MKTKKLVKTGSFIAPAVSRSIRNTPRGQLAERYKSLLSRINKSGLPVEDFEADVRQTPKRQKPAISVPFVRVPAFGGSDSEDDE